MMLKKTQLMAGVAIISVLGLAACGFGGNNDEKSGGSSTTASGGTTESSSGTTASGAGGGAKPEDQGAGGGTSGGTTASGGGSESSGGSSGGSNMQEVGDVIEGFVAQLSGDLDNYQQNLAAGYGRAGPRDVITGLQAGNSYTWDLGTLQRGQTYMILGACDQDCSDVDLFLLDSRGQQIGQDVALDDHPQITVTPGGNERFSVRIQLVNCEVEPCYVAGRVLQQGR